MIYRIDPRTDPRWQALVDAHPDAGIFHTTSWLEALRRTYGYQPVVYTATPPGRDLKNGVPFCQVRSRLTGDRLVSLPFSDHCQPLASSEEELNALLSGVKHDAATNKWRYVEIKPLAPYSTEILQTAELTTSHDAVIHKLDLRHSREEVIGRFHKDCIRRKIARSEREHLRYTEGRSEDLLQQFYALLLLTRRRHQLPPQPLVWFRNLIACLGERLKIRIASLEDGTPIASILTLSFKNVVTYKYGCSDPQYNALGGTVMLMWRTIQDAMNEGAGELDLGRSDYDTPGLITFKGHWGAAQSTIRYYRHPAAPARGRTNGFVVATARRLAMAVPDSVFATIGGLFYRHAA